MRLRGGSFRDSFSILMTMQQAAPRPTAAGRRRFRLAVVHGGGPAPGMNTAVRAAVRLGLDRGYTVLAVNNGFRGLRDGDIQEMQWMSVSGWVSSGGADIGTNRYVPSGDAIAQTARQVGAHRIDGLLMIGGWAGTRPRTSCTASGASIRSSTSRSSACRRPSTTTCPPPSSASAATRR
jgi:6-phosphofructokinase 1